MFEVYREADYGRQFRVVFFTELDEHNKEREIGRAMAGEHFFDGFIPAHRSAEAKAVIDEFVQRLNRGDPLSAEDLARRLGDEELLVE